MNTRVHRIGSSLFPFPFSLVPFLALLVGTAACGSRSAEPGLAAPSATFSRSQIALGSPVDVTYRFEVASGARVERDYHVMVHFLDSERELMWTDDHQPPTPTSAWQPGEVIEYTRTVFVPVVPYIGETTVAMGLYSPVDGTRVPLTGQTRGQRAYTVASVELLPSSGNVFLIYRNGWHESETSPSNPGVKWQWTRKTASLSFRNPRRESTFYLHGDNPSGAVPSQRVSILLNDTVIDSFDLPAGQELVHRTTLPADRLGNGDMAELQIQVDPTFVPALLPASSNRDSRELGIRIFHVFVEPHSS